MHARAFRNCSEYASAEVELKLMAVAAIIGPSIPFSTSLQYRFAHLLVYNRRAAYFMLT